MRRCASGNRGCWSDASESSGTLGLYVHWIGAGKDVGFCWVGVHFVVDQFSVKCAEIPVYIGMGLGAAAIQESTGRGE